MKPARALAADANVEHAGAAHQIGRPAGVRRAARPRMPAGSRWCAGRGPSRRGGPAFWCGWPDQLAALRCRGRVDRLVGVELASPTARRTCRDSRRSRRGLRRASARRPTGCASTSRSRASAPAPRRGGTPAPGRAHAASSWSGGFQMPTRGSIPPFDGTELRMLERPPPRKHAASFSSRSHQASFTTSARDRRSCSPRTSGAHAEPLEQIPQLDRVRDRAALVVRVVEDRHATACRLVEEFVVPDTVG